MREKSEFKKNFNGEDIKPGEVMIPFEYTELDDENCTNRECIKTLTVGGRNFKVIYKAVPEEWAKRGTSALTLVQNEELGHYDVPNSVSMNGKGCTFLHSQFGDFTHRRDKKTFILCRQGRVP